MKPPDYDHAAPLSFGGLGPDTCPFDAARFVVLPLPFERTTSYLAGTRAAPREILLASSQMELWDEETGTDAHDLRIVTLPEMELPFGEMEEALAEIRRVVAHLTRHGKFLAVLGGEHSITAPIVEPIAARYPGLSVLQIDAHADLRDSYLGNRNSHASAMRRVLEHAPITQVGIRSLSREEAEAVPGLRTRIFYDWNMRRDADWMDRVVESLGERVYLTIDCDGLDPAIMPAVGTPEPGGLGWTEILALLRKVVAAREVVACDLVELCPIPGVLAPTFLAAKLLYKLLTYRFVYGTR